MFTVTFAIQTLLSFQRHRVSSYVGYVIIFIRSLLRLFCFLIFPFLFYYLFFSPVDRHLELRLHQVNYRYVLGAGYKCRVCLLCIRINSVFCKELLNWSVKLMNWRVRTLSLNPTKLCMCGQSFSFSLPRFCVHKLSFSSSNSLFNPSPTDSLCVSLSRLW